MKGRQGPKGNKKVRPGRDRRCVDVTSYDHDFQNDMLCTRVDGSTFHTSYAGADAFLAR